MGQSLAGKVALVTGGSRGIGAAIARRLAADGATVAISYSASGDKAQAVVRDIESKGGRAAAFQADQADAAQVEGLVRDAHARFGGLDILVNSAGVFAGGPIGDPAVDAGEVARQFAINVGGVAAAVRAAVPLMRDGGRIISIGTAAADRVPFPGAGDYVASKSAVAGYTRAWARDLGPRGITVNIVQPGGVDTDMNPGDGPLAGVLAGMSALGRHGKPEEIAGAVAFLAGPDATFITGASLNVDGGLTA